MADPNPATTLNPPPGSSLIETYLAAGRLRPAATMMVWTDTGLHQTTLSETLAQGAALAAGLRTLGVGPGDVIATQLPQSLELAATYVAAAYLDAVVLSIVPAFGAAELAYILRESAARVLITRPAYRGVDSRQRVLDCGDLPALAHHIVTGTAASSGTLAYADLLATRPAARVPAATRGPEAVSFLCYTSGTTSAPKGAMHNFRSMYAEIIGIERLMGKTAEGVTMSPWPAGHVAGALMVLRFLMCGRTLVLMDHWDAKAAADLMEKHSASFGSGTPFHLSGLLDAADAAGHALANLTSFQSGAAPVPPSLVARCNDRGIALFRSYGSTEHITSTYGAASDPLEKRLHTEGRVVPGAEVRVCDDDGNFLPQGVDGEIVSRGLDLFLGYTREELNREAFLPGGWYRSGDIGHLDAEGYLVITDRKKDIIIRGGENISSREIEDHLHAHPAVAEVAAVAAPDERLGEIVCVFVVLRPGTGIDIPEIERWFRERGLSRRKVPERLEIVAALPRNTTGKVLKQELRKVLREGVQC